jgi:peroxiredoxin
MGPTLCLLGCLLTPAQPAARPFPVTPARPAPRGDWILIPRLRRSEELVYRGTFTEEAQGLRVQFHRTYALEARLFVLDTPPRSADVALLTTLRTRPGSAAPASRVPPASASVRLDRFAVDLHGKITPPPNLSLVVPSDGAPPVECGFLVEAPGGRVTTGQAWEVVEPGRPVRTWRVAGSEMVNGTSCLKLVGLQQSEDWDRPRADRPAWRRRDTVWLAPRLGLAQRVERVVEQREPAHSEVSQRGTLRYELESSFHFTGQLAEDRQQEVLQALAFRDSAAPLLSAPARYGRQLGALLAKINYHIENQPPTPYREAVLQTRRHVEAARRGEVLPAAVAPAHPTSAVAAVGRTAPDFLTTEFAGGASARLSRWLGRPAVLVFYHPASATAADVLHFAQDLHSRYGRHLGVVALSVSDDSQTVLAQRTALHLSFPILHGSGLRVSYAIESTPKIVLLDATGVVRGAYLGWGRETPAEVLAELRRWLAP